MGVNKLFILLGICLLGFFWALGGVCAQSQFTNRIEVTPQIIPEQVKASELHEYTITIKNNAEYKANIYAIVNDVSIEEGRQEHIAPSKLDKQTSLARWIRIKRSVIELMPGESIEVPLEVQVDINAISGKRYATISFPQGNNQKIARSRMMQEPVAQILLDFEVVDFVVERAQIKQFKPSRSVFLKPPVNLILGIENFGNRSVSPAGAVYIYNRRETMVGSIEIETKDDPIEPETSKEYNLNWLDSSGFGKFKAKLELEYGQGETRDMQDTAYFWVLPLKFLLIFLGGLFFVITVLTIIIFRKTFAPHQNRSTEMNLDPEGVINLRNKKN
jgi:hypothetical protein